MHIVIVGVDHSTAPITLRERLSVSARQTPQLLQAMRQQGKEGVILSTCNRLEMYGVYDEAEQGRSDLLNILSEAKNVAREELEARSYSFFDEQAEEHLFGVASGLYSLVPGEPQIQGQVVDALEIAQGGGYAGPVTSALFREALVAGKRARNETNISRNAASISHVAVQLARRHLLDFQQANVLLVGSGKMSEVAARNLRDNGAQQLVIVNRTQANAVDLAQALQAIHRPFTELDESLAEADVVISSTSAPRAVITMERMQRVVAQRNGRAIILIDIALPRDVEPEVAHLPGVFLYNLDDLQAEVAHGVELRMQEAEQVKKIIAEEVQSFEKWKASLGVTNTISDLRKHVDTIRQQELERTLRHLSASISDREAAAIQELTTRLMNKLLHTPMLQLKDAAVSGQGHVYAEAMRYLFGLEEESQHEDHNRDASQQARHDTDTVGSPAVTSAVARS
jgi:glutamyl-tRNA reductase